MSALPKMLDTARTRPVVATEAASGGNPLGCGSHSARWYCVETERAREAEVRDRLDDQGFGQFLPLVIAMRPFRPGILQAKAVPAFPGYVFVRFDAKADRWRSIIYTRGVKGLFCSSRDVPTPVPQRQMDVLLALGYDRPIAEDPRPKLIEAGAKVRITTGPFADFDGVCLWDDGKRVALMFDLFGHSNRVTVARRQVETV
jgi:transcription antitermination factor NusG